MNIILRSLLLACAALTALAAAGQCQAPGFGFPSAGRGSIEFSITPRTDNFAFGKNAVLFRASSEDGSELYEIHLVAEDLLVLRDYGRCIRASNRVPHNFARGVPRRLKLAWNGPTTKFFYNGKEVEGFNQMVVDPFSWPQPFATVSQTQDFDIWDVSVSSASEVRQYPADERFLRENVCPDLSKLFKSKEQETYRGIALHNFPDQAARDKIKAYIDLLSPGMAAALKRVIFAEKGIYPAEYWRGRAYQGIATMLLTQGALDEPATFFHEAAHLYDYSTAQAKGEYISKQWQLRLMDRAYVRAKTAQEWQKTVLGAMDGSSASEEMASFAGHVYEFAIRGAAPAGYLNDRRNKAGLDFLLEQGIIGENVYDKVNPRGI